MAKKPSVKYRERIEHYLKILQKEEFRSAQIEGVIFFCVYEEVMEKIKAEIPSEVKKISVLSYHNYFPSRRVIEKQHIFVAVDCSVKNDHLFCQN